MPKKKTHKRKPKRKNKQKIKPKHILGLVSLVLAFTLIIFVFYNLSSRRDISDVTGKAVKLSKEARYAEALDQCDTEQDSNYRQRCYGLVIMNQIKKDGKIVREACMFLDLGAFSDPNIISDNDRLYWKKNIKPMQDKCFEASR